MLRISPGQLSPEALTGLIEEWVTRDGTDYGEREVSTRDKAAEVRRLLSRGELLIVYDPACGQAALISARDWEG